ncbi:MAG: acyl-CoA dehydrogenase family protein [Xanthomonadales bacterium]|nr:acyl-CoA dehydrogenase family protein [Xanthomonadales bacterium]
MFEISARARELLGRLQGFMDEQVLPLEPDWYQHLSDPAARGTAFAPLQGLQQRARAQGLWNLFLADTRYGAGLSHLEYAPLAEAMGRSLLAPAVFNATQPDCSSIDLLALYGNDAQRERWLRPLLAAELRAALAVSEGTVGSSDPANLVTTLAKRPEGHILHGRKAWVSGAADPACRLLLVLGLSHPEASLAKRYSLALVPRDAHGISVIGQHSVLGYADGPGGYPELEFDQVFVPDDAILLGPGRGLEALQAVAGAGRLQQSLMLLGLAQRAFDATLQRARSRVVFGKPLGQQPLVQAQLARAHGALEQSRLLCLNAASVLERRGSRLARESIALIKACLPETACQIIDLAIQLHGAAGLDGHDFLAHAYAHARGQRLADGPEELHWLALGRMLVDDKARG